MIITILVEMQLARPIQHLIGSLLHKTLRPVPDVIEQTTLTDLEMD